MRPRDGDVALPGQVELAEISGSDTFVHVDTAIGELVAQLTGVHEFTLGEPVTLYLEPGAGLRVRRGRRPAGRAFDGRAADMARIDLDLAHAYKPNPQRDDDYALLPLKMSFDDGGAYALLGPSGCGKTTLLNIVSGLVQPSHGTREVRRRRRHRADAAAAQHRAGVPVPGHLRHDDGGREPRVPAAQPRRRRPSASSSASAQVAEMLELSGQLNQRAAGLAADAKQKISLGRGLVREDVSAVLFDEPLTVIDPHLKWQLRRKLKQIHHELKLTLIYVTHDQVEALTFAEQVVVMTRGRAVQVGSADRSCSSGRSTPSSATSSARRA